jgi:hypothetical protein
VLENGTVDPDKRHPKAVVTHYRRIAGERHVIHVEWVRRKFIKQVVFYKLVGLFLRLEYLCSRVSIIGSERCGKDAILNRGIVRKLDEQLRFRADVRIGIGQYADIVEYRAVAYEIAKAKTNQAGRLSAKFVVPEDFGFMHDIVLQQGGRLFAQTGFSIDMTVEISPKSGPVGTPMTLEVKGIGWRSLVNSWDLLYDNNFTGWISSVTTHGSARFTIPATGGPGVHILEVLHGELTFPYRNMQQSPEPDRPRWAFPFTVTAGAPVLPPPPERQAEKEPVVQLRQDELVATPQSSGVGEPVLVRSDGLAPGTSYRLNWTRVVGNRMIGAGWQELSTVVAESRADDDGMPNSASRSRTIWAARMVCGSTLDRRKRPGHIGSRRWRCRSMSAAGRWAPRSRSI